MTSAFHSERELLRIVLEPLLEDFQYWFSRSRTRLESESLPNLTPEAQADLLERVKAAQREVEAARSLFKATDGTVGVEMGTLMPWHQLVTECWRVAMEAQKVARSTQPPEAIDDKI